MQIIMGRNMVIGRQAWCWRRGWRLYLCVFNTSVSAKGGMWTWHKFLKTQISSYSHTSSNDATSTPARPYCLIFQILAKQFHTPVTKHLNIGLWWLISFNSPQYLNKVVTSWSKFRLWSEYYNWTVKIWYQISS